MSQHRVTDSDKAHAMGKNDDPFENKDIVVKVCTGRQRLGFGEAHSRYNANDGKEKRNMITDGLRNAEEEKKTRSVGMAY